MSQVDGLARHLRRARDLERGVAVVQERHVVGRSAAATAAMPSCPDDPMV